MQEKEFAFVVKNFFPGEQKLSVITQTHGKIFVYIKNKKVIQHISHGSFLQCTVDAQHEKRLLLDSIDITQLCSPNNAQTIYWFHHLIEVCHFVIPYASPSRTLFAWISNFMALINTAQQHNILLAIQKKIYILYFFELMGITEQPLTRSQYATIATIHSFLEEKEAGAPPAFQTSCTSITDQQLNIDIVQKFKEHPCFQQFKTLRYVYSS